MEERCVFSEVSLSLSLSLFLWSVHLSKVRPVPVWQQHSACQIFPITVCKFINSKAITTSSLYFDLHHRGPPMKHTHTHTHHHSRSRLARNKWRYEIYQLSKCTECLGQTFIEKEGKQRDKERKQEIDQDRERDQVMLWTTEKEWSLWGLNNKATSRMDDSKGLTDCLNEIKVFQKAD